VSAIICMPTDFDRNWLGLPSLLAQEIDGAPVLYHTVSRLTLSDRWKVVLVVEGGPRAESNVARAREMLGALPYEIHVTAAADVPNRAFLRRSRLWSIRSWRGGIGSTTWYDEDGSPAALAEAAKRFGADAVALIAADSPFADPALAARLFDWHYDRIRKALVTVTGVPPGLAPAVFNAEVLDSFARQGVTLAASMAYRPSHPQRDLAATEAHFEAEMELRLAPWRLTVHSARQLELMRALAARGVSPRKSSAVDVVRALSGAPDLWAGRLPAKIDVEPTTRFAAAPFHLKAYLQSRPIVDMPVETLHAILQAPGAYGDVVVSLEGLGDALLHPDIMRLAAAARDAGVLGVHVATSGVPLDDSSFDRLSAARLDVLSASLGAHFPETYAKVFGGDGLARAQAALEALRSRRLESSQPWPLVIAEITKMRPVEADIEPFYDYWQARSDQPIVRPFNDFAGQVEDLATIHLRTSARVPCRKIFEELYIDAEGVAWPCRQDILRTHPLGDARSGNIEGLWRCEFMEKLRAAHAAGDYGFWPLCETCKEWYYT
jgi:spiro-SPASM protein